MITPSLKHDSKALYFMLKVVVKGVVDVKHLKKTAYYTVISTMKQLKGICS